MGFGAFPPCTVLQSDRIYMNHNSNNTRGQNNGGGSTTLPAWIFGNPLADKWFSESRSAMKILNLYIEPLYLFAPIFNVADVQRNLLGDVPNNLPAPAPVSWI